MDLKELKEILQILDEKEITEFELEEEGMKLRVRKAVSPNHGSAPSPPAPVPGSTTIPSTVAELPPAPTPVPTTARPAPADTPDGSASGLAIVKSPIVGTFYRTADPNAPPFVNVGDTVRLGQVLCIIEAMKLMNEIEAEVAGEIVKIHHDSGQPVQYGDPLFSIRPEH